LSKLREETPVVNRDTGAYYWRQTPILTLLADVVLALFRSWVRMNCNSVFALSFTKDSWVDLVPLPGNVIMAGCPPDLLVHVPDKTAGDPVPIELTVPFTFCCPVIVTLPDPSNAK